MTKKVFFKHALIWAIFIAYEVLTVYFVIGRISDPADYFFHYLLNITAFYTTAGILNGKRKSYQVVLYLAFEVVLYIAVNFSLNYVLEFFETTLTRPTSPLRGFLIASFWRCFYFAGLGAGYAFANNLIRSKEELNAATQARIEEERSKMKLEKELLIAHNATLRAQINPHLFFNTLNFIYNSVYKLSNRAGDAIMLLADITRYSLTKADAQGLVFLKDEIASINDLVALNQIRFDSRLSIRLEIEDGHLEEKIVPLVMLTLVENMFKYGELMDPAQPALIRLKFEEGYFHFATRNKKAFDLNNVKGTGMGIANARMRMQQAYPDKFFLRINETEDCFFTDLTIQAECLCLAAI